MFPCEILWVQSTLVGGEEASALGSRGAVRSLPLRPAPEVKYLPMYVGKAKKEWATGKKRVAE
jgi:hypothetical protein